MTKIRFTKDYAGPQGIFRSGDNAEVDPAFAAMLVQYHTAEYTVHPSRLLPAGDGADPARDGSAPDVGLELATADEPAKAVTRGKRTTTRSKPDK